MINREQYNRVLFASFVIVWSIFLSVVWKYFRWMDLMYYVPFLDISEGHNELSKLSCSPEEYKKIPFWEVFPFFVAESYVFIFFYLYRYVGPMVIKIRNWSLDVWHLQMIILGLMFLDYLLTHRQTPFRDYLVVASGLVQFWYCWTREVID